MSQVSAVPNRNRIFALVYGVGMAFLGFLSLTWCIAVPHAVAQPADFSSETGILDIPAIEINDQRTITDVQMQVQDTDTIMFQLVDYGFESDPAVEQIALVYGESINLDESLSFTFLDVLAESRCPSDVLCITAGEVTVIMRAVETLDDSNTKRTDFGLTLQGLDISEHYFNGRYFRLVEATPYPISTVEVEAEDYVILVEVSAQPFGK